MSTVRQNCARHAADDLLRSSHEITRKTRALGDLTRCFDLLARKIDQSPKFLLPDNGEILVDHRKLDRMKDMIGLGRCPFPSIVIEFPYSQDPNPMQRRNTEAIGRKLGMETFYPDRRLALVCDLRPPEEGGDSDAWRLTADLRAEDAVMGNGLFIWAINYSPRGHHYLTDIQINNVQWSPSWAGLVLPFEQNYSPTSKLRLRSLREIDPTLPEPKSKNPPVFSMGVVPLPIAGPATIEQLGPGHLSAAYAENCYEVLAAISLTAALSCRNVATQLEHASEALNRKRLRNGKPLLHDYHLLTLNSSGPSGRHGGGGGESQGLIRSHLRRGHIRVLEDRQIWVNATVVNPQHSEFSGKDYRMKAGDSAR